MTQRGAGNAETVITAIIDAHIGFTGHMAIDTGTSSRANGVECMRWCVMVIAVALHAESVAFLFELIAVSVMAITACHTGSVHFTLQKGTVFKDFIAYLSVRVIQ